jgi:CysZ protein
MGIIDSFTKAVAQLPDPRLRRVLIIGILGSFAIFAVLWIALWWAMSAIAWTDMWGIGWLISWFGDFAAWVGSVVFFSSILLATFLLFPAIVTIIVGFFLEEVVDAVETRHYPNEATPRPQPLSEVLAITIKSALIVAAMNLIFLPIYLLLFLLPPLNLVVYYLLNGYLVSREYYELVALRRFDPRTARQLRRAHRGRVLLAGVILVFFMTIPIVNFVTPVLATAFMVHIFQGLPRRREFTPDTSGPPTNIA